MDSEPDIPHGHGVPDADIAPAEYCGCGTPLNAHHHVQEPT